MASFIVQAVAGLVLASLPGAFTKGTPEACSSAADMITSCGTKVGTDSCCYLSSDNGGQLVQTQFWDTDPETGPDNSWTIHGLWPDNCDGTYESSCDSSRAYTDIGTLLKNAGDSALVTYMNELWVNDPDDGTNEEFWEHEWAKHGTCISTLDPSCYTDYTTGDEAVDFFNIAVNLFKTLPTYQWLEAAGIVPSSTATYTAAAINAAIKAGYGYDVSIQCSSGALDQVYYSFYLKGSLQTGTFVKTDPVGASSSCASTGIKWLPKSGGGTIATTTTVTSIAGSTSTSTAPVSTSTATGTFSGKGYLEASSGGCLISAGTWYGSGGTCATYTAAASGSGFTLTSSKGTCGVSSDTLSCGSGYSTVFGSSGGLLTYDGSSEFYADAVPSGSTQETVSTDSGSVSVTFTWTAI